jgi:hypothetical protein
MTNQAQAHDEIIDLTDLLETDDCDLISTDDFDDLPTLPYAVAMVECLFSEADIIEATWPW